MPEIGDLPPTPLKFALIGVGVMIGGPLLAWVLWDRDTEVVVMGAAIGFVLGCAVGLLAYRKWVKGDAKPVGRGWAVAAMFVIAFVLSFIFGPKGVEVAMVSGCSAWFGGVFLTVEILGHGVPFGRDGDRSAGHRD